MFIEIYGISLLTRKPIASNNNMDLLKEKDEFIRLFYDGKKTEANEKITEIITTIYLSEVISFAKRSIESFLKEESK